ncbi:hypothetical protein TrCOL_g11523 [Triparma columacea]|uniref:Uncharacterized protein n=1 Tax=Triparma columacea TaxID=722753 RepID=A0A9W7GPK8_9STRA|nr:hypothetical protein TrCOL_g11523 [Triparma columacea]
MTDFDEWLIIDTDGQILDNEDEFEAVSSTKGPQGDPDKAGQRYTVGAGGEELDPIAMLKMRMGGKKKKKKGKKKSQGYAVTCALEAIKGEKKIKQGGGGGGRRGVC